ncbi:methyltransferase domain-containing protein [Metallosphaera tengchongensis]|uniref:Methyltransferase domain-containing protein n=1 Tax=Metallosphaera tengchongensis TaxID=1532350 RepID=A0A6N0NW12_9CREN|nr:methyltransferase domain-containing protein [Metallosphaera tengchongensis]QKR00407.1 methyltransferase domain-containing protein [Metallosphaera tengchongensis]
MKCIKVPRRELGRIRIRVAPGYQIIFDGDFALIPVLEPQQGYEAVECSPAPKETTPKLRDLIPNVSSFYVIGDIMVLSPKKEIIKAELEKLLKLRRGVRSIYIRKRVSGELRINELEHVAGEKRTVTEFREGGLRFIVDIAKVYVNPSMATERLRLVKSIPEGSRVLDVFTGYGALAIHVARKIGYVVAGDLNLDGLYMARESLRLNSCRISMDLVQYDARYLPFREKSFDWVIGDNPTMINVFLQELCRVSRKFTVVYRLGALEEGWERVNDYSKDLVIAKRVIRCQDKDVY